MFSLKVSLLRSISLSTQPQRRVCRGILRPGELEEVRDWHWVVGQVSRLHQDGRISRAVWFRDIKKECLMDQTGGHES